MLKRIAVALAAILVLLVVGVLTVAAVTKPAGEARVPAGMRRNEARYVTMRDGVRIAIDVWYPATLTAGQKVPTLINATRYVRATKAGILARAAAAFGRFSDLPSDVASKLDAGYAVVLVDARGSGASTGTRLAEWSPDELADYGEIVDEIVKQPWSNGRVGAYGVSYEGNTAEMFAATGRAAVKGVAPLYDDYDAVMDLAMPGGVLNEEFLSAWGAGNNALDRNDFCAATQSTGWKCTLQRLFVTGIKPVDADPSGRLLDSIVGARKNYDVLTDMRLVQHARDSLPSSHLTFADVSPFGMRAKVEPLATPMLVRVGWLDAGTVNVALSRFFSLNTPQRLEIGPWSHGGGNHVDPFLPDTTSTVPSSKVQHDEMMTFFDGLLKGNGGVIPTREIRYFTMNDGRWRTTTQWPPAGITNARWYFGDANSLSLAPPTVAMAADRYTVDTTATTGARTRWHTQLGGSDVVYPDRTASDVKLLSYTSAPLPNDVEITGVPVVWLKVSSSHTDGAFFAYLEDVAPSGRVTYITEGMLRARDRKVSDGVPPYRMFGPYHAFDKANAAPLVPGDVVDVPFELFATSVRLKAGHRIRLALSGADRPMFAMIPAGATPTWMVQRSATAASFVDLPMLQLP
jgi:uncharacterized protein